MQNPLNQLGARERVGIATAAGVLLLLGIGAWSYRQTEAAPLTPVLSSDAGPPADIAAVLPGRDIATGETIAPPGAGATPSPVVVHVVGAVRRPGVYTCRPGERIYQAIFRAGGFRPNAQRAAINLADRVQDADQIIVPAIGIPDPQAGAGVPSPSPKPGARPSGRVVGKPAGKEGKGRAAAGSAKFKAPGDGTLNLNAATAEQLQRLPGVGPAMAERILTYRKEIGKFTDVSELKNVTGIGEKKFARMQPFLSVR